MSNRIFITFGAECIDDIDALINHIEKQYVILDYKRSKPFQNRFLVTFECLPKVKPSTITHHSNVVQLFHK